MKHSALTQFKAKGLPEGKHADGQGLWLVKRDREHGKWVLRFVSAGKRKEMGLGRWPDVGIAEARERAAEARRTARGGNCPVEARRKARRVVHRFTVKEAVQGCFEARKASLKGDGEAGQWMSPVSVHVIPKIGKLPVEEVDQHVVKELFAPIWHEKPASAAKAMRRLNLSLLHAAALGLSVDLQACLKARALLGKQRHVEEHIPALPYKDAPAFYKWLCGSKGTSALALRFLMLTLARTSEVRFATGDEIRDGVWYLSAERTKSQTKRRIPLVNEALALAGKRDGLLFPTSKGNALSDMAMAMLMRKHGYDARPHGFRATFRTWCEECADADFETKEACLGHAVDSGVVGAYQRSDRFEKRRKLLKQWEVYLLH